MYAFTYFGLQQTRFLSILIGLYTFVCFSLLFILSTKSMAVFFKVPYVCLHQISLEVFVFTFNLIPSKSLGFGQEYRFETISQVISILNKNITWCIWMIKFTRVYHDHHVVVHFVKQVRQRSSWKAWCFSGFFLESSLPLR